MVLNEQQLILVLTDVQLIEGAISKKILDKNNNKKDSPHYYEKVFEKHGITQEIFDESITYYSEKPEELEAIYDKVLVELSKKKAQLQSKDKATDPEEKE